MKKALCSLKQAPRAWFSKLEAYFARDGFEKCHSEQTLFTKTNSKGKILVVSVYVDDLIYTADDEVVMSDFKQSMMKEFDMSDLGAMRFFLGIEVLQNTNCIYTCQRKYALDVLKRFGMEDCKAIYSPLVPDSKLHSDEGGVEVNETYFKRLVGSLMYLTSTRPDFMFIVSYISRYMAKPTELHLQAAKKALTYIKGTMNYGICYKRGEDEKLVAFTDGDYAGDVEDRKSTSGYVFLLNSGAVSWSSKKQPLVTLSTTEAEFVATGACACQAVWVRRILEKLGYEHEGSTTIMCDSSSAIKLPKNPVMHGRSKHIDVRFHFPRDLVRDGIINLDYCGTKVQVADIMTKPLKLEDFLKFRKMLGVCEVTIKPNT